MYQEHPFILLFFQFIPLTSQARIANLIRAKETNKWIRRLFFLIYTVHYWIMIKYYQLRQKNPFRNLSNRDMKLRLRLDERLLFSKIYVKSSKSIRMLVKTGNMLYMIMKLFIKILLI